MANEELVKAAVEQAERKLKEQLKKLEIICQESEVRVKIIAVVSSPGSTGKTIVQHVSQLRPKALFMVGPEQEGLKWKLSRHFSAAGYVKKNVPRGCEVHIISGFNDSRDNSTCSPRVSKSSSRSSLFSINPFKPLDEEDGKVYRLEDWLHGQDGNDLKWQDLTQIAVQIAALLRPDSMEHDRFDLAPSSILLRDKHLHEVDEVLANEEHETVRPLEKTSTRISSFGLLVLQILSRRPSPGNLVEMFDEALRHGKLEVVLDPSAGWPIKSAREIAVLALECRRSGTDESSFEELREVLARSSDESEEELVMKLDLDFFQRSTRFSRSDDDDLFETE